MNKVNFVYAQNGIFSLTKEILQYATTWTNLEDITLSERRQLEIQILYHSIYMKYPEQAKLQREKHIGSH